MRLGEREVGDRVRVSYRLTERGWRVLEAEMRRYSSMAKLASMRLATDSSPAALLRSLSHLVYQITNTPVRNHFPGPTRTWCIQTAVTKFRLPGEVTMD